MDFSFAVSHKERWGLGDRLDGPSQSYSTRTSDTLAAGHFFMIR
jgi:hypothetical protein